MDVNRINDHTPILASRTMIFRPPRSESWSSMTSSRDRKAQVGGSCFEGENPWENVGKTWKKHGKTCFLEENYGNTLCFFG